jgi:hypothetical protein
MVAPLRANVMFYKISVILLLVSLWLIGIQSEKVPPFRFIAPKQVRHFDKDAKRYHDMIRLVWISFRG